MTIDKIPTGTRGARVPSRRLLKLILPFMERLHRRKGDRFKGQELLYLKTLGARSGEERHHPVARFDDGAGGWWIVASFGGAAQHPAWYHNVAAHPESVRVEIEGRVRPVTVTQLDGTEREAAWTRITAAAPTFLDYQKNTDRLLPVLRLTPR